VAVVLFVLQALSQVKAEVVSEGTSGNSVFCVGPALSTTVTHTLYLPLMAREYELRLDPDDPEYVVGRQWGLEMVRAPAAWYLSTGQAVTVAVVDTGADLTHPDLIDGLIDGWDYIENDEIPADGNGHGTHVAGIVGATTDNARGVAGMGWGAKIMPVRVLDDQGEGDTLQVALGIRYAVEHGAKVINLSLGGYSGSQTLADTVAYAQAQGAVIVAAAGNHNTSAQFFPAAYEGVIGVSATNLSDEKASFSNYGTYIDVAAPGDNLYSTLRSPGTYGYMSGTSMAAPMVSGLVALLLTRYPVASPAQIVAALENGADDLGSEGWDPLYGWGRINAANSMYAALKPASALPVAEIDAGLWEDVERSAAYRPGEVIVRLKSGAASMSKQKLARYGVGDAAINVELELYVLRVPVGTEAASIRKLEQDVDVVYAHPNYVLKAAYR
jgi:thermitase